MSYSTESTCLALKRGEMELQGQFLLGSNYAFLVRLKHGKRLLSAVYKPMRGVQPLWDFPPASLAGREVAAFLVSRALGWGLVSPTVLRDGPFGPGSLQQFIDHNPNYHYFVFTPEDRDRLRPVVVFDLLLNNADRKGSHVLVQKHTRRLFGIDHGLCFHVEPKLRTVLWDFAGQGIPGDLLVGVRGLQQQLLPQAALRTALAEFLVPQELRALAGRIEALLEDPVFPDPPRDRRAFPYPPL
jgi:hypothetical protein